MNRWWWCERRKKNWICTSGGLSSSLVPYFSPQPKDKEKTAAFGMDECVCVSVCLCARGQTSFFHKIGRLGKKIIDNITKPSDYGWLSPCWESLGLLAKTKKKLEVYHARLLLLSHSSAIWTIIHPQLLFSSLLLLPSSLSFSLSLQIMWCFA